MTTAYTSLLGLALPVTGELSGTWGDTVNNSITSLVDSAIAGTTTLSADTTLTTTTGASNQARQAILLCTGHSANITITAPAQSKIYTVINASATYTVKIRGATPTTGITIPVSSTATVAWNGSDFVDASGYINGNLKVNGTLSVTGAVTFTAGTASTTTGTGTLVITGGLGVSGRINAANFDGIVGANTAAAGSFTTLSATGNVTLGDASTDTLNVGNGGLIKDADGNLGVGTTATNISTYRVLAIGVGSGQGGILQFQGASGADGAHIRMDRSGSTITGFNIETRSGSNAPITLLTNSITAVTIDTSQNVGIGTATPAANNRLTLSGTNASKLTLTGGTTQNGMMLNAVSTSNQYYIGAGNDLLIGGDKGFLIYDVPNARAKFFVDDVSGETRTLATTFLTCYTGSTERTRIDSSGNLLVGATSPTGRLTVADSTSSVLTLRATSAVDTDGRVIGTINFQEPEGTGDGTLAIEAAISGLRSGTDSFNSGGRLAFYTRPFNGTLTQAMTLDASGNLLVGNSTDPLGGNRLLVQSAATGNNNRTMSVYNTAATSTTAFANRLVQLSSNGSGADVSIHFSDQVANNAYIGMGSGALYFAIGSGTTKNMTLQSSGTLSIGTTVDYGGILLTPPNQSWGEGLVINPASGRYSGVYFRLEAATGSSYTGTWALGKNASTDTGGEALSIIKNGLTGGSNYRVDSAMTWATNGNTLVGFNMQIGSGNSLYASGKLQITGGKTIINSNDASYTQLQIGNPDSGGEAGICYVSGATAFGAGPTSTNGDTYIWAVGAGVYGLSGNNWAIGNKGWAHYNVSIAYNATSWAGYSDERAKDIIKQIDSGLDILRDWRTVYYSFKFDENKKVRLGLVAQDVLKTAPELVEIPEVEYNDKGQLNGMSVYYAETVAVLVKAVQELEAKILALEARLQGA